MEFGGIGENDKKCFNSIFVSFLACAKATHNHGKRDFLIYMSTLILSYIYLLTPLNDMFQITKIYHTPLNFTFSNINSLFKKNIVKLNKKLL